MGKHHLRKDKTCENCGHTVEERYCSRCGQENVETRQTFGHLVRHFMEDLTHYESNFWKTIKYLLFRPALLTQHYLSGKRMTYVAPVRLYLFISFIAFFLPAIIPNLNEKYERKLNPEISRSTYSTVQKELDSLKGIEHDTINLLGEDAKITTSNIGGFQTAEEYDSAQNALPVKERDKGLTYFLNRQFLDAGHNLSTEETKKEFIEGVKHNFPKVLFIYLPLFAFIVWLFHGKKRWYYFDHAIFTLHNFSFLLLISTIFTVISHLIPWHYIVNPAVITFLTFIIGWFWSVYYFYRGHRKLYKESMGTSFFKATIIIFLNSIVFTVLMIGFVLLMMFSIH
ncbi:DUF3667 domain-containing protein [Taibaiella lutea]|uniref:DUF3667 domain-containing protein n=1 Tax=Taibaiella lutea TaxID=2608001 RepID=A0A5M6CHS0_9BACT|nr:DUF3667 domain-containing protein [Taibaiella lutea]KAA5534751.1 DUF3667 domain-containing protein [Taibaiella lutea]